MKEVSNLSITNTTKGKSPDLPFDLMKETVLGKVYDLSLVFVDSKKSEELHLAHQGKTGPANVLSFPLSDASGELFIDLENAGRECAQFERNVDNFIAFLFIHGLFHLKGMTHGSIMEREEKKIREKFGI